MRTDSFETEDGVVVPAVTAAEMREIDRVAVDEVGLQLLQMMENAGRTLALSASDLLAESADGQVVVLAGAGGNGGGGLCAARHLANHGVDVTVVVDRDPDDLTGAPATQLSSLRATAATVTTEASAVDGAALAIDALVGYGLTDALKGRAAALVAAANGTTCRLLSLDVPSGMNATTGETPGPVAEADRTLTLALPKTGLGGVGDLWLADIGIPAGVYGRVGVDYTPPFAGHYRVRLNGG